jgi:hypothetical protein
MRTWAWLPFAGAAVIVSSLSGCASKPCRERGWIGGDVKRVQARGGWLEAPAPSCGHDAVIGMPASAGAPCGLLVLDAPCDSPLAQAGVARGDLIVALDGKPVADPLAFRRAIETRRPGSPATLQVWRAGATAAHPVVVGREQYERRGTLALVIPIDPHVDLNPFDDGISVFGLVVAEAHANRRDLGTVERTYLARAVPGRAPAAPVQETVRVGVFPIYVGAQTRVLAQQAVLPAR